MINMHNSKALLFWFSMFFFFGLLLLFLKDCFINILNLVYKTRGLALKIAKFKSRL